MHLYFIRHGQSYVNLKDWDQGFTDEGLTDLGQRQAKALAGWLPGELPAIDVLYCSTMRRARETAAVVANVYDDLPIRYDDRIREIGNNRRDHTPWPNNDLPTEYADFWATEKPFTTGVLDREGGESWMHFRTRVGMFIEEVIETHRGQTVLAVCHGGVIEAVFSHVFNLGAWPPCEVWDHNTAVTHFEHLTDVPYAAWRLHYHNRITHLQGVESA